MSHVLILIFILSLTVSFAAAFVSYLFYLKYKNRSLRYCVLYNIILFLYVFIVLFRQYIWNTSPANASLLLVMIEALFYIWFYFMFYYFPRFIYSIIEYPFSTSLSLIIRIVSLTPAVFFFFVLFMGRGIPQIFSWLNWGVIYVFNTILGLMILYLFIVLLLYYKKITHSIVQKIVKNILIITAAFLPGMIYDLFIRGKLGPNILINGSVFCAFFIFAWNIMALIFFFRFYSIKIHLAFHQEKEIPESFYKKHQITSREKEIIGYILEDKTSVQISSELFISPRTVDKHIENIYKKIGVNSKGDLISLLKKITVL